MIIFGGISTIFNVDVLKCIHSFNDSKQVAEQLMIMHEDCLQGNYESIEKLRRSNSGADAVSQSKQVNYSPLLKMVM